MQKQSQTQMTFDFGFDDHADPDSLPEVMDIGDAEDFLTLPPSGKTEERQDLFSSDGDEKEDPEEDFFENDPEEDGVEIITGDDEKEEKKEELKTFDAPSSGKKRKIPFDAKNIKRAALAFLSTLSPHALACDVPAKFRKHVVDCAAFWVQNGKKGQVYISSTAVVDVIMDPADALAGEKKILPLLAEAENELEEIRKRLQKEEPFLKENDSLFAEEEKWDFSRTKDPAYHAIVSRIAELKKSLYSGTRFDKLRKSGIVEKYYIAVPENLLQRSDIAEEWGLVYIGEDLSFRLVKEAQNLPCSREKMNDFALNIGRSAMQNVLFANGIVKDKEGHSKVVRQPRKRRM